MRHFLSGGTVSTDALAPAETMPLILEAAALTPLPLGEALRLAEFSRSGPDLLIDHGVVTIRDYFAQGAPQALYSDSGLKVEGATVALLAGSLAPGQYAGPAGAGVKIGVVTKLEGDALVKRADGSEAALKHGDPVFQNDVIKTGAGGGLGITFNDKSVFAIGQNARMTLDKLVYDEATGKGESSVTVLKGMFKFVSGEIAAHNPGEMQIKTPVATIGIRGTTGGGVVEGEGQENSFYLAKNADGTHGRFDVVTENGRITIDQPFSYVPVKSVHDTFQGVALKPMPAPMMQDYHAIGQVTPPGKYDVPANKPVPVGPPAPPQAGEQQKTDAAPAPPPQGERAQEAAAEGEAPPAAQAEAAPQERAEAPAPAEPAQAPQEAAAQTPISAPEAAPAAEAPPEENANLRTNEFGRPSDQGVFSTDHKIGMDFANQVIPSAAANNAASKPVFVPGANNPSGTEFAPSVASVASFSTLSPSVPVFQPAPVAPGANGGFAPPAPISGASSNPASASGGHSGMQAAPPPAAPPVDTGTQPPPPTSGVLPPPSTRPPSETPPPPPPPGGLGGGAGGGGASPMSYTLTASSDAFIGTAGNDSFHVTVDADYLSDDSIHGGDGIDSLIFASSVSLSDTHFTHTASVERLEFLADSTVQLVGAHAQALIDSNGGQVILDQGTNELNLITTVNGDVVIGGTGQVILNGAYHSRVLVKADVAGHILSNGGNDTIIGGAMADNIQVLGASSNLSVQASAGNDTIHYSASLPTATHLLDGGAGIDALVLSGAGGAVVLSGIKSIETFYVNSTGAATMLDFQDSYFFGNPIDGSHVTVDGSASTSDNTFSASSVTHPVSFVMHGGTGMDMLTGGALGDFLSGGAGADYLSHGSGNGDDTLLGGAGADTLIAGMGQDSLSGGLDDDSFVMAMEELDPGDMLDGGEDIDTLIITSGTGHLHTGALGGISNIERFLFQSSDTFRALQLDEAYFGRSSLADSKISVEHLGAGYVSVDASLLISAPHAVQFDASASNGKHEFIGGAGNDSFSGGSETDDIEGGGGGDTLYGGGGADVFVYNLDNPNVSYNFGGAYDMIMDFNVGQGDKLLFIGGGIGSMNFTFTNSGTSAGAQNIAWLHNAGNVEIRIGTGGNDFYLKLVGASGLSPTDVLMSTWNGTAGGDTQTGGSTSQRDVMIGFAGNDSLLGDGDSLSGGSINDLLKGGDGSDTLDGGVASNMAQLYGGRDDDTLILRSTNANAVYDGGHGFDTLKILQSGSIDLNMPHIDFIEQLDMQNSVNNVLITPIQADTIKSDWLGMQGNDFYIKRDAGDAGSFQALGTWQLIGPDGGYSVYHDTGSGLNLHISTGPVSGVNSSMLSLT